MTADQHYRNLERMYVSAPVNELYKPDIRISENECSIAIRVKPEYFHAAGSLHGAVYFKMLDDAAYFAAASGITDVFIYTASFEIRFYRPVTGGSITAKGRIIEADGNKVKAASEMFDDNGRLVAKGSGIFVRGKGPLSSIPGYAGK